MTDTQAEAEQVSAPAVPVLLHGGTYQLYQTPSGGLHLSFRREYTLDDNGAIAGLEYDPGPEGFEHLPFEIPAALIQAAGEAQAEFDRTGKPPSKMAMLKLMMGMGLDT